MLSSVTPNCMVTMIVIISASQLLKLCCLCLYLSSYQYFCWSGLPSHNSDHQSNEFFHAFPVMFYIAFFID